MKAGSEFRLEDAGVRYGAATALAGVDLTISSGEAVAVVGPSGAGKTTLLRLLNASVRPTHGSVRIDGDAIAGLGSRALRALRAEIGTVHQDLGLVPNVRVVRNVLAGALGRTGSLRSIRTMLRPSASELERVHVLLERVGIEEKLFQRTDRLSGGQQQRVAIARALYQEPRALLADEPVSSVDPARALDTVELLVELAREQGLTLCTSIHDVDLARRCFPRIVGLREGRVEFDRPSRSVDDASLHRLFELDRPESRDDGT